MVPAMRRIGPLLALLLGLATPVAAQAPPPVPALPDTARLTTYSLSGTTCVCSVGFAIYGDNTDIDEWIEVFVNGTKYLSTDTVYGWSLSSVTGPLATIPRPITNAVLTFNTAQTATVQIVGARRPRRLSQFAENRGVPARDLNQVVTDEIAMLRETWDRVNRTLRGQPGEVFTALPLAAVRAGTFLAFDGSGLPIVTPASGNITTVNLGAWNVFGNASAAPAPGASVTMTAMFDGAFCNTNGAMLTRGASAWACQTTIPAALIGASSITNAKLATMADKTFKCNTTGGATNPSDCTVSSLALISCPPNVTILTTGVAQTYTLPTCNGAQPAYLEIDLVGGGASAPGSGTTPGAGTNGNASNFIYNAVTYTAGGGLTATAGNNQAGGVGGTATGCDENITGGQGGPSQATSAASPGSMGGGTTLGPGGAAGQAGTPSPGNAGGANTGAGGGSGGTGAVATAPGAGGGSTCRKLIAVVVGQTTATYTIGATTTGGTAGGTGAAGGGGAAGRERIVAKWL